MFSGDSSGTVIVWNTYNNVEAKSKKIRTQSTGQDHLPCKRYQALRLDIFTAIISKLDIIAMCVLILVYEINASRILK